RVDHIRRELRVLDVYRAFQALVYLALSLGSLAFVWMPLRDPVTARATALIYLSFALLVLARDLRGARALVSSTSAFLTADVVAAFLMTITVPAAHTGIAAMLMINVGAAALLLSPRLGGFYFAIAAFCFAMGSQMRASEALAEQRGTDLANLAQVNDLIIRRMKTGV